MLGVIVAGVWGTSDFLGGLAARKAGTFLVVAMAHSISCAAIIAVAAGVHARAPGMAAVFWSVMTGVASGASVMIFYRALAIGEMGLIAALSGVLTAVVPVAFAWITEGHPGGVRMAGFGLALAAIFLIAYQPGARKNPRGVGLAILAGLGFGAFLITSKYASQGAVLWPLALSRLTSATMACSLLAVAGIRRRQSSNCSTRWSRPGCFGQVILLAGSAGILESFGNGLYMLTTWMGRLDVAAVLSSLYPAATILLAIWLLRERVTRIKAAGMILALIAVVVISL